MRNRSNGFDQWWCRTERLPRMLPNYSSRAERSPSFDTHSKSSSISNHWHASLEWSRVQNLIFLSWIQYISTNRARRMLRHFSPLLACHKYGRFYVFIFYTFQISLELPMGTSQQHVIRSLITYWRHLTLNKIVFIGSMRLLNTETFNLEVFENPEQIKYAILSHRWVDGKELKIEDLQNPAIVDKLKVKKPETVSQS